MKGRLILIGCGPGDADLLTLKALKAIRGLQVALIDHLISDEILAMLPTEAKIVFVGKEKGKHSFPQEEIHRLIGEYTARGLVVGRLKCGDPYIFGRGTEEALYAASQGIATEVIPGISSALAAPLAAGIAPTARGVSTGVSVVSAHLAGDRINLAWIPLLALPEHTTVVLMGLSRVRQIVKAALEAGVDPALPCAVVSNGTLENQQSVATTLERLAETAKGAPRPALLVFGSGVSLEGVLPRYKYEIKEALDGIARAS